MIDQEEQPPHTASQTTTPAAILPDLDLATATPTMSSHDHDNLGFEQDNMAADPVIQDHVTQDHIIQERVSEDDVSKTGDCASVDDVNVDVRLEPRKPKKPERFQRNTNRRVTVQGAPTNRHIDRHVSQDGSELDSVDGFGHIGVSDELSRMSLLSRTQSLRLPGEPEVRGRRGRGKLLRDLSFADSDGQNVKKFDALNGELMGSPDGSDEATSVPPEVVAQITSLMSELLSRGKVTQVALVGHTGGHVVTSLPKWDLSAEEVAGLRGAAADRVMVMTRVDVEGEIYTCFRHGRDGLVCRADTRVLVCVLCRVCVLLCRAAGDAPGSALREAGHLAQLLRDRGW